MRGSRKFCQRGSNFDKLFLFLFFYLVEPSSVRQRKAIEMAFHWRADDGSTLNAGYVAL